MLAATRNLMNSAQQNAKYDDPDAGLKKHVDKNQSSPTLTPPSQSSYTRSSSSDRLKRPSPSDSPAKQKKREKAEQMLPLQPTPKTRFCEGRPESSSSAKMVKMISESPPPSPNTRQKKMSLGASTLSKSGPLKANNPSLMKDDKSDGDQDLNSEACVESSKASEDGANTCSRTAAADKLIMPLPASTNVSKAKPGKKISNTKIPDRGRKRSLSVILSGGTSHLRSSTSSLPPPTSESKTETSESKSKIPTESEKPAVPNRSSKSTTDAKLDTTETPSSRGTEEANAVTITQGTKKAKKKANQQMCAVAFCRSVKGMGAGISFFRFPKDYSSCFEWALAIGRPDLLDLSADQLHSNSVVCANHFGDDDFTNIAARNRLKMGASPKAAVPGHLLEHSYADLLGNDGKKEEGEGQKENSDGKKRQSQNVEDQKSPGEEKELRTFVAKSKSNEEQKEKSDKEKRQMTGEGKKQRTDRAKEEIKDEEKKQRIGGEQEEITDEEKNRWTERMQEEITDDEKKERADGMQEEEMTGVEKKQRTYGEQEEVTDEEEKQRTDGGEEEIEDEEKKRRTDRMQEEITDEEKRKGADGMQQEESAGGEKRQMTDEEEEEITDEEKEGRANEENEEDTPASEKMNRKLRRENIKLRKRINQKTKRMNAKIKVLTNQLENLSKKKEISTIKDVIALASKYLEEQTLSMLVSQIKVGKRKGKGRRWSLKDKSMAVSLYHASPKCYKLLRKLLALPSVSTIKRLLEDIKVQPGLSPAILEALRNKVKTLSERDRYCSVVIDEMSIKEHLHFDEKNDVVTGLENFGRFGGTPHIANQALVVMVRGLASKWKQPLGYFFSANGIGSNLLERIVKDCLSNIISIGLHPVSLVCDQGPNNRSLFKNLGLTKEKTFFTFFDHDIYCMYDVPHLIKSTRNNLMNYDICFEGTKTAKWSHIQAFFEKDQTLNIKFAPKLTQRHFDLTSFSKMKVSFAAQVLSRTVAAGILTHCSFGSLPPEASFTAEFCEKMDILFDSLNSRSSQASRDCRKPVKEGSCHIELWKEMIVWLQTWKIRNKRKVWFLDGLIMTLTSVIQLWQFLKDKAGFKYLFLSRLNQDCIENLFSQIRAKGGDRDNPSAFHFQAALKCVMIDMLMMPVSGQNCLPDFQTFLLDINDFSFLRIVSQDSISRAGFQVRQPFVDPFSITDIDHSILAYVAGSLIRMICRKHCCEYCYFRIASDRKFVDHPRELFIHFKAWSIGHCDFGNLSVPTDLFFSWILQIEENVVPAMNRFIYGRNVMGNIKQYVVGRIPVEMSSNLFCCKRICNSFLDTYIRMRIHYALKFKNREKSEKNTKPSRKLLKVTHA